MVVTMVTTAVIALYHVSAAPTTHATERESVTPPMEPVRAMTPPTRRPTVQPVTLAGLEKTVQLLIPAYQVITDTVKPVLSNHPFK